MFTIFLPAVGWRWAVDSELAGHGTGAGYWSSTETGSGSAYRLSFAGGAPNLMADSKAFGYLARCVR